MHGAKLDALSAKITRAEDRDEYRFEKLNGKAKRLPSRTIPSRISFIHYLLSLRLGPPGRTVWGGVLHAGSNGLVLFATLEC